MLWHLTTQLLKNVLTTAIYDESMLGWGYLWLMKKQGPSAKLTYLGSGIGTQAGVSRFPQDTLWELLGLISKAIVARKRTVLELQSWAFCTRLSAAIGNIKAQPFYKLNEEVKEVLGTWEQFLNPFHGVSFWREKLIIETQL